MLHKRACSSVIVINKKSRYFAESAKIFKQIND